MAIESGLEGGALTHVLLMRLEIPKLLDGESTFDRVASQEKALVSFARLSLMELNKMYAGALKLSLQRLALRVEGSRLQSYVYLRLEKALTIVQSQMDDIQACLRRGVTSSGLNGFREMSDLPGDQKTEVSLALCRLSAITELAGSGARHGKLVHYVVETDVQEGWWQEISQWYEEEHLPGLANVPGCVVARRYLNLDSGPKSFACYDLESEGVLTSPEWLAVRATPWSSKARPHFVNTHRNVYPSVLI